MKGTRRKSVSLMLAELRRTEDNRIRWVRNEFRAKRKAVILADEIGRRLVKAKVMDQEQWEAVRPQFVTDCLPEIEVQAFLPTGRVARVGDRPLMAVLCEALGVRLKYGHLGSPVRVERDGRPLYRVTVWMDVEGGTGDDDLWKELKAVQARVQYDRYVPVPADPNQPVTVGRHPGRNGKTVTCRIVVQKSESERATVVCSED